MCQQFLRDVTMFPKHIDQVDKALVIGTIWTLGCCDILSIAALEFRQGFRLDRFKKMQPARRIVGPGLPWMDDADQPAAICIPGRMQPAMPVQQCGKHLVHEVRHRRS